MNKLDIKTHYTSFEINEPSPGSRLLVLVPAGGSAYITETRRIWELANASGMHIRFLGLCNDAAQAPSLRRELVTLSALIQFGRVTADVKIESGKNWLDVMKHNYKPGDMIVCFAGQNSGISHKPLSEILESNLKAPVYIISGSEPQKPKSKLLSQWVSWVGSIGIVVGFGLLQISITQLPKIGSQNVLFILSILPEYWLIWVWNSLFK
jgi:hypothetical protein